MWNKYSTYKLWKIYCSFFIAVVLQTITFFPEVWNFHPSWVMILLIYWVIMAPNQVNIGTSFFLGIILDIVLDCVVGTHSLSLSTLVYLVIRKIHFFKCISVWMQSCVIVCISLLNQSIILLVMSVIVKVIYPSSKIFWYCILDGSIWPITIFVMHKIFNMNKK